MLHDRERATDLYSGDQFKVSLENDGTELQRLDASYLIVFLFLKAHISNLYEIISQN
jgi:hypothetical protein